MGVRTRLLLTVALVALVSPVAIAMPPTRELIEMGRSLADPQVQPAAELAPTSMTGQQASKAYARCLENSAIELGRTGVDAYSAVRAAKGACTRERTEFYSAVYQDRRASAAHRSSTLFANQMIGYFDEETDAQLPAVVMRAAPLRQLAPATDKYGKLEKLKSLLDSRAINPSEFESEKAKVLAQPDY